MADDGPRVNNSGTSPNDTTVPLQQLLMSVIHSVDVRLSERIQAEHNYAEERSKSAKEAVDIARISMESRLDGMNEFRKSLEDARRDSISRPEYDAWKKGIEDRVTKNELKNSNVDGRLWAFGTAFTILLTVLALVFKFVHAGP